MGRVGDQHNRRGCNGEVSIVLAEPNLLLREKIAGVLARNDQVWCVVQVSRKDDLVRAAAQLHPDFILVDVAMLRDSDSVEVLKWFCYASRIYALVDSRSEPYERLCTRLGLNGLLEKSSVADDIAREISALARARESKVDEPD